MYPIYRKYADGKTFFKINSETEFEEAVIRNNKRIVNVFHAKIHPDRLLIRDMIACDGGYWLVSNEDEFELR